MFDILTRKWWVLGIQGIISILFGIVALMSPESTLTVLVLFVGAYALTDGIMALVTAAGETKHDRLWLVLGGVAGIAIGVIAFANPALATGTLVYAVAYWAIITGIFRLIAGIEMTPARNWLYALSGLVSIVFGGLLLFNPANGALTLVWLVAFYALMFGAMQVAMAWRLRGVRNTLVTQRA